MEFQLKQIKDLKVTEKCHILINEIPFSNEMCMPIAICKLENSEEEYVAAMRNTHIDVWNLNEGKRFSMNSELDDWSTHHQGRGIECRHLVGKGEFMMYAGHKGHGYFVKSLKNAKFKQFVKVFEPYHYDKNLEEPDLPPDGHDHISSLVLTSDGTVVVVCNGANQDIHLYHFEQSIPIKVIKGQGSSMMKQFFFPPGCDWFYYANEKMVGKIDLRQNQTKTMLPHPCKVRKVVGIDSKFVITIGEDSILRIYDKTMEPFQHDMSHLTGQVKVSTKQAVDQNEATFLRMIYEIAGGDLDDESVDTRGLLTTNETENYWTQPGVKENGNIHSIAKFHTFSNSNYIGVSHTDNSVNITECFTIWNVQYVNCVRRIFFPLEKPNCVCVHDVIDDQHLLVSQNRRLKLIDMNTWKVAKVFQGQFTKRSNPYVILLPDKKSEYQLLHTTCCQIF